MTFITVLFVWLFTILGNFNYLLYYVHRISKPLGIYYYSPLYENEKADLRIEEIVGATIESGHIMFLTKWKHSKTLLLVESTVMNEIHPQLVISYYENLFSANLCFSF